MSSKEESRLYWESYYCVTNILISCGRCITVKFGQMPIHSVQVLIHASEIFLDIHTMSWEPYYYVTNILICCGRCIAMKFGQMPIHSVQVPICASEILSPIHAMYWEPYYYVTNILMCCGRCKGAPARESRTGSWLVSPAVGCEKKIGIPRF